MDKIRMLQDRRSAVKSAGKSVRADIAALSDEGSFVELSTFSFSKNELFPEGAAGEGVVAGFITIDGYPFCVVAQNGEVLGGGVSEAGCKKIGRFAPQRMAHVLFLYSLRPPLRQRLLRRGASTLFAKRQAP